MDYFVVNYLVEKEKNLIFTRRGRLALSNSVDNSHRDVIGEGVEVS